MSLALKAHSFLPFYKIKKCYESDNEKSLENLIVLRVERQNEL